MEPNGNDSSTQRRRERRDKRREARNGWTRQRPIPLARLALGFITSASYSLSRLASLGFLCAYLCVLCASALNRLPVWLRRRRIGEIYLHRYPFSSARTAWVAELACAMAAMDACASIWDLVRLAASAATSVSRMRDSADEKLVTSDCDRSMA